MEHHTAGRREYFDEILEEIGFMRPIFYSRIRSIFKYSADTQAPHPSRGVKASDQSLGSSFGCSFGSFNVNDSNNGMNTMITFEHK